MPVMDGMTATRLIRQHEFQNSLPRVPIFALTGLASAAARNEALESGFDRLITKPVPFDELAEVLMLSKALLTTRDSVRYKQN
jgi:CheY-like chemotaxis protein